MNTKIRKAFHPKTLHEIDKHFQFWHQKKKSSVNFKKMSIEVLAETPFDKMTVQTLDAYGKLLRKKTQKGLGSSRNITGI